MDSHPKITRIEWPVKSPDLNFIENVWSKMVFCWPDGDFANRNEIFAEASNRCEELRGTDYIDNLYNSMTKRMNEVINNGGNWCSY